MNKPDQLLNKAYITGKQQQSKYVKELEDALATAHNRIKQLEKDLTNAAVHANTDSLTGLPNYRSFYKKLNEIIKEAERGRKFNICMVDIDHFKSINDQYGHSYGNNILMLVASVLRTNVRVIDTVARFGGEEFVIILPDLSISETSKIVERLRISIENIKNNFRITASFGVASYSKNMSAEDLINKADGALYHAKNSGRNKICLG